MNTATLAIGLALLMAAIASAYTYAAQRKRRKIAANAHRIALAVKEYFAKSGAEIGAQCHPLRGRFLVLVESEPLKRFRYSHIVEASLIGYVEKTLGLQVDRVFWRFPLPVGGVSPQDTADLKPSPREDEYVVQGIRQAITNPDYHVAEDSWDQFEKARQNDSPAAEELNDQSR